VVTRGAKGVDLFEDGHYRSLVAQPPRVRAVDTVGAGDCFNGALAAALAENPTDLLNALRFAVAASALSVTRRGAQASMPERAAIRRVLDAVR
jgi:ribokinase